jgi:tight adherence protein B
MSGSLVAAMAMAVAVLVWPERRHHDRLRADRDDHAGHADRAAAGRSMRSSAQGVDRGGIRPAHGWTRRTLGGDEGRPGRSAAARGAVEAEVVGFVEALAAALRAGLPPPRAFDLVARSARVDDLGGRRPAALDDLLAQLSAQAGAGSRLEPLLRSAADRLDSPGLASVAAGWAMAERHGAPVVVVLDGLGSALRDAARSRAAVQTALAGPRATAALLGVLPLGGVVLGELVGVHPVGVLVGTAPGRASLVGGLLLTWVGRAWMRRLVLSVERG